MSKFFIFYADWHEHSRNLVPVVQACAEDYPACEFKYINADNDEKTCQKFQVDSIPAVILCTPGQKAMKIEGQITAPKIVALCKNQLTQNDNEQKKKEYEELYQKNLNQRLQNLLISAPLLVFMKGTRDAARCKFSKKLMALFEKENITEFSTFNILEDEDVRQGLKTYSNWKTYPQVYVNGKLIGGVDVVEELIEDGEFQEQVGEALKAEEGAHENENLNEKIKRIINSSPIMLFMKGNPDGPRCGFSRQIVELLHSQGCAEFGHFDILTDEDVRQGIKTYSNWQTFPQLYMKGELIGGLDVCKELVEEDEFKELVEDLTGP